MTSKTRSKESPTDSATEQPAAQLPTVQRTWALSQDCPPDQWPTNIDLSTTEGRITLANAGSVAEWIPRDGGEYEITAVNYVLYPDSGMDQDTGERREFTRVCFIDRDGRMAKFSSDFGPSAMRRIAMLFTPEEWRRGIVIRCAAKQSKRSGRVYGEFRVVRVVE